VCAVLLAGLFLPGAGRAQDFGTSRKLETSAVLELADTTTRAWPGDLGYGHDGDDTAATDSLSLRLRAAWRPTGWLSAEVDYLNARDELSPLATTDALRGAARFRRQTLRWDIETPDTDRDNPTTTQTVDWYHELDRALLRLEHGPWRATVGRQPITWGVGRFWQPLDVFVAFSPTAVQRDFKPGIDAVLLETFPSAFSSVSLAGVASPRDAEDPLTGEALEDSMVLHHRGGLGVESAYALLAGRVQGEPMLGGALETIRWDAGWRLEFLTYEPAHPRTDSAAEARAWFAVAGVDNRFAMGLTLAAEWYHHSQGAERAADLSAVALSDGVLRGRVPQLSRDVLAVAFDADDWGLWHGSYALFLSAVPDDDGTREPSSLHQATLRYSISDNAVALFSLIIGTGRGLDEFGRLQSEFGAFPDTLLVNLQVYL
jgi:hypothetical protein